MVDVSDVPTTCQNMVDVSDVTTCQNIRKVSEHMYPELELELIQTQMTQKPMLRAEVYARALRASQNRKEDSL